MAGLVPPVWTRRTTPAGWAEAGDGPEGTSPIHAQDPMDGAVCILVKLEGWCRAVWQELGIGQEATCPTHARDPDTSVVCMCRGSWKSRCISGWGR